MFYIIIKGKREYLDSEIIEKYNLKAGMHTPFTGYEIFEDSKKEVVSKEKVKDETSSEAESETSKEEKPKEGEI